LGGRGKPKNTRKIDISENRYDVRIVKAEARGPTRSVFSGRPGDVKRSPNAASRSAAVGLSASERAGRPAMRNLSFRHAKDSIRFRGVLGSSRPEAQSPSTIPISAPPAPDHRRFEKLDRKKLRNGGAKALESLARKLVRARCASLTETSEGLDEGGARTSFSGPAPPSRVSESGRTTVESWRSV
jgi:hypothetical protein